MAWQDSYENDNGEMQNATVSPLSDVAPQATNLSSQLQFSPDTVGATWPQDVYETPFATTSRALFSPAIDESLDLFDASFGDVAMWGQWDAWEDLGNTGDEITDAQQTWSGFAMGILPTKH